MAKGQQRRDREHKKPKQLKAKPAAAVSPFSMMQPRPPPIHPARKK
jgi:hypothetical protein